MRHSRHKRRLRLEQHGAHVVALHLLDMVVLPSRADGHAHSAALEKKGLRAHLVPAAALRGSIASIALLVFRVASAKVAALTRRELLAATAARKIAEIPAHARVVAISVATAGLQREAALIPRRRLISDAPQRDPALRGALGDAGRKLHKRGLRADLAGRAGGGHEARLESALPGEADAAAAARVCVAVTRGERGVRAREAADQIVGAGGVGGRVGGAVVESEAGGREGRGGRGGGEEGGDADCVSGGAEGGEVSVLRALLGGVGAVATGGAGRQGGEGQAEAEGGGWFADKVCEGDAATGGGAGGLGKAAVEGERGLGLGLGLGMGLGMGGEGSEEEEKEEEEEEKKVRGGGNKKWKRCHV